ncbi:hypothetical protein QA596_11495 [Balneolales bacterium ANBcel1]|nr:hypothetical protein [Balneolales bacterium ANBcel1]
MVLLHHHYGTMEFILPAMLSLLLIFLWAASMAALSRAPYQRKSKILLGVLFVVVPFAAIVWLGKEVYLKYEMSRDASQHSSY